MKSSEHKQDLRILLAFIVGLILMIVPDIFFYDSSSHSLKFWLNLSNTGLDAALFIAVFVFLKREVHKRRAINHQLVAANRLKSEFLQIAAHDLRNPLNAIVMVSSQIPPSTAGAPDPNPGEEIRSIAQEMDGILEGLLDAAALEEGTLRLKRAPIDLGECVFAVVERYRPLAERKSQSLLLSAQNSCVADVDVGRIKQAVENLISNAIKFSPLGKPIAVTLHCAEGIARIEVADEGPGLTAADKTRLFGPFQRLSARPTGGESTIGLGLANARRLVELHGGSIGAESEGAGMGSRFWIELPTRAVPEKM